MYNVNEAYKKAMTAHTRDEKVTGTLKIDSSIYDITDENIVENSLIIKNQCVNSGALAFGCVYSAEMSIELRNILFDTQYISWLKGGVICLTYHLFVNGEYIPVPLGIYVINSAEKSADGYYKCKCYDMMSAFDKDSSNWKANEQTPYQIISYICRICGVELANSKEFFEKCPNGVFPELFESGNANTYRDILAYLAQEMCCFCTINREGKLEFRHFGTESVLTIPQDIRFSTTIDPNPYSTWIGWLIVDLSDYKGTDLWYGPIEKSTSTAQGCKMILSTENPIFAYSVLKNEVTSSGEKHVVSWEKVYNAVGNMVEGMQAINDTNYRSAEISVPGMPALDLGDLITLETPNQKFKNVEFTMSDGYCKTYVTNYIWKYRGAEKITCETNDDADESSRTLQSTAVSTINKALKSLSAGISIATLAMLVNCTGSTAEDYIQELFKQKDRLYNIVISLEGNASEDDTYDELIDALLDCPAIPKIITARDELEEITVALECDVETSEVTDILDISDIEYVPLDFNDNIAGIVVENKNPVAVAEITENFEITMGDE